MSQIASASIDSSPAVPIREDALVIGMVGSAHMISHFSQLLLPPLFPWLKDAFNTGYTELGFLMALFFSVSCVVQALSGFLVDRWGPRPILLSGLSLLVFAAFGFSFSQSYSMLIFFIFVAGLGNGVFHPVDYTLINRRVSSRRLGHAYSAHGISGNLGWAAAPAILVPITLAFSWRHALFVGALIILIVLVALWFFRQHLQVSVFKSDSQEVSKHVALPSVFSFLRLPAVWICLSFFLLVGIALGIVQAFAPEAARQLHGTPVPLVALCLSAYMLLAIGGMVVAGFIASDIVRSERLVALGFGFAAAISLSLALAPLPGLLVPVFFGALGFFIGLAGPARDFLIKKATPTNASGRVYGVIYSGLDIGQALSPLLFAWLMDAHHYKALFIGLAALQLLLVANSRRMAALVKA